MSIQSWPSQQPHTHAGSQPPLLIQPSRKEFCYYFMICLVTYVCCILFNSAVEQDGMRNKEGCLDTGKHSPSIVMDLNSLYLS